MEIYNTYGFIILASAIVILSYFFNILSRKTSIPSVIMLILLGVALKVVTDLLHLPELNLQPVLELLGVVGLIMIVLEAALDLRLTKEKMPMILRSSALALVSLLITSFLVAFLIKAYLVTGFRTALIYAVPLSIMSSAIIIPSVAGLEEHKKEFMIYESTMSDILGIMMFYFLIQQGEHESGPGSVLIVDIILTTLISLIIGYVLILTFQRIETGVKLFMLISVLLVLYSVGKLFHLSSLLIILVFGLMLNNRHIFFFGRFKRFLREEILSGIYVNFHLVTLESSFVVRTFFFVIFGFTLVLSSLLSTKVFTVSLIILVIIYGIRYLLTLLITGQMKHDLVLLAPRGLITILLFYTIPASLQVPEFDAGILLYVILATSTLMALSLYWQGRRQYRKTGGIRIVDADGRLLTDEEINTALKDEKGHG